MSKKYRVVICIEEVTRDADGHEEDVYETGWAVVAGPEYNTEAKATALKKDLVERAKTYSLIQEIAEDA